MKGMKGMYEKLDKLRAEVEKWKARIEDDKAKLKLAEQKLQEAENNQILADVGAMNLTPEQLAQFLQLVQSGQLKQNTQTGSIGSTSASAYSYTSKDEDDFGESEDLKDED